jgi:hypothetical protein
MEVETLIAKRLVELDAQANAMRVQSNDGLDAIPPEQWQQWATSAHHILRSVFGVPSPHYDNFARAYGKCEGWAHQVAELKGIFRAAKADYEGG